MSHVHTTPHHKEANYWTCECSVLCSERDYRAGLFSHTRSIIAGKLCLASAIFNAHFDCSSCDLVWKELTFDAVLKWTIQWIKIITNILIVWFNLTFFRISLKKYFDLKFSQKILLTFKENLPKHCINLINLNQSTPLPRSFEKIIISKRKFCFVLYNLARLSKQKAKRGKIKTNLILNALQRLEEEDYTKFVNDFNPPFYSSRKFFQSCSKNVRKWFFFAFEFIPYRYAVHM